MSTQPAVLNLGSLRRDQGHDTGGRKSLCEGSQHGHQAASGTCNSGRASACCGAQKEQQMLKLLPLVRRIAFQMLGHLPSHVELDDLVGAGMLGLIDAVRKFDAGKHVKLESYARHRIRGAILDSLREQDMASRDMRKKNKKVEKLYRELEAKLGRPVRNEEMAEALGISLKKWYRTVNELRPTGVEWLHPTEITQLAEPDEESLVSESDDAFDHCYRREQKEIIQRAMECLSERECRMMSLYYQRELTMKEIGTELGIDESRVSQLHSAALGRLKSRVKEIFAEAETNTPPAYVVAGLGTPQSEPLSLAA